MNQRAIDEIQVIKNILKKDKPFQKDNMCAPLIHAINTICEINHITWTQEDIMKLTCKYILDDNDRIDEFLDYLIASAQAQFAEKEYISSVKYV